MIPFYWIDAFHEYDRAITENGFRRFDEILKPVARQHELDFETLNIADLFFGFDQRPYIYHQGSELLAQEACVRVPYANPQPQTERRLHSLARIIAMSGTWRMMNLPLHLDRDKEWIYQMANLIGAKTVPSCFAPDRISNRTHLDLIERQLGAYPYIVKPTSLFAGLAILKADNRSTLAAILDHCAQSPHAFLIQPFLKNAVDCRIFLERHEVIACQMRIPAAGSHIGPPQSGRSEEGEPDPVLAQWSEDLSRHVTDGFLAVDWLLTDQGAYLSEIDLCGTFFGLPEPRRTEVLHAFFRCARNAPTAFGLTRSFQATTGAPAMPPGHP